MVSFVSIREHSWSQNSESGKSVKSVDKFFQSFFAPLRLCVSNPTVTQPTPRSSKRVNSLPVQLAAPRRLSPDAMAPPIYFQRNPPASEPYRNKVQRYEKDAPDSVGARCRAPHSHKIEQRGITRHPEGVLS